MFFGNSPSDFGFLPPSFKGDVQVFTPTGIAPTQTQNWQTWTKPKGTSMVYMMCIGGGGGGGGGFSAATGNARGGGGGGGSGAITTLLLPAILIPDSLKISVGAGGQGGISSSPALSGGPSYISLGSSLTTGISNPNLILRALGGTNGGTGTSSQGGSGGAAGNVTTIAVHGPISKLGFFPGNGNALNAGFPGQSGTAGGAQTGANGTAITAVFNVSPLSGGSGGAGVGTTANTGFAGGNISLQAVVSFDDGNFTPSANKITGGSAGNATIIGGNGNAGIKSLKPFLNTGGSGGGSASNQVGGDGGIGGYGCGGGGGGGGTTGGRGGNGGDGLVMIVSW